MANQKKHKGDGKRGPDDQGGDRRPTHFRKDRGFERSWEKIKKSDAKAAARIAAQLASFKREWSDPSVTRRELNSTWYCKALGGEPGQLGVLQIRLSSHRVALLVIGEDQCVWLLEIFRKTGRTNPQEMARVAERARKIRGRLS